MEKIYSLALAAVMALCSLSLVSCNSEKDDPYSDEKTVLYSESITIDAVDKATKEKTMTELQNFLQKKVGNKATVKVHEQVSISGTVTVLTNQIPESQVDDVKNIYKSIQDSELDALFSKIEGLNYVDLGLDFAEEGHDYMGYVYISQKYSPVGTWTYTASDGVVYTLNITDKKNSTNDYLGEVTIGEKTYSGKTILYNTFSIFESDEQMATAKFAYIYIGIKFDGVNTDKFNGIVKINGVEPFEEEPIFTRVK